MVRLLEAVKPYLKLKREQAEILLELQRRIDQCQGRRHQLATTEWAVRKDLYRQCRLLNKRGPRNDQLYLPLSITHQLSLNLEPRERK